VALKRLVWFWGFCSSETDHLCTTKSESGRDADGVEAIEAIFERPGVVPVFCANVSSVIGWDTANVDHNGEDDKTAARHDLDAGKRELDLTVTADSKELVHDEEDQEDGDPDCYRYIVSPEFNGDGGSSELEGEDDQPSSGIFQSQVSFQNDFRSPLTKHDLTRDLVLQPWCHSRSSMQHNRLLV